MLFDDILKSDGRKLILMRGIPGSGKSTLTSYIRNVYGDTLVASADDYFMRDGEYRFDPKGLHAAHAQCKARVVEWLDSGAQSICIVDNTFIEPQHIAEYTSIVAAKGGATTVKTYIFSIQSPDSNRSTHGVPTNTMDRLRSRQINTEKSVSCLDGYKRIEQSLLDFITKPSSS